MRIIDNLEPTEAKKAVSLINNYGDDALEMFKEGKSFDEVKKIVEGGLNKAFVNELPEILKQKRITLDEFNNLRLRDVAELTDSEKEILKFIRNSVPMPNENTLMQKVITVEDIEKYLGLSTLSVIPDRKDYINGSGKKKSKRNDAGKRKAS